MHFLRDTRSILLLAIPLALLLLSIQVLAVDDCSGGAYTGSYADGSGTYVTSDSVHESIGKKCWKDYFLVQTSNTWGSWTKSSGNVYCTGTSTCTVTELTGTQHCVTQSETLSFSVSASIADVASAQAGVSFSLDDQHCFSAQDTTACQWTDDQCHCVWTQQQYNNEWGYMRQRCNTGNGDYTVCMTNWFQEAPTKTLSYGCGSPCTDT